MSKIADNNKKQHEGVPDGRADETSMELSGEGGN